MTLERLSERAYGVIDPVVSFSVRLGLSPNHVTLVALVLAFAAAFLIYLSAPLGYVAAALLVVTTGLLDIVDGRLARRTGEESDRGDYLDHVVDRYADIALVLGVTAAADSWLVGIFALSGVLLTAYLGTQAQAVGAGRVYAGLLGRADILALVVAGCVFEAASVSFRGFTPFEAVLVVLAFAGHITAVQRFVITWREL